MTYAGGASTPKVLVLALSVAVLPVLALAQAGGKTPSRQEADRFVSRWVTTCKALPAHEQESLLCENVGMEPELRRDPTLTGMTATAMCQRLIEKCGLQPGKRTNLAKLGDAVGCRETVGVDVAAGCGVGTATASRSRCGPDSEFGRTLQDNNAKSRSFLASLPSDVRQRIPALEKLTRVTAALATTARVGQNIRDQACAEEVRSDTLFDYCQELEAAGDGRHTRCMRAHMNYQARAVAAFANKTVPEIVRQVLSDALAITVR